MNFNSVIDRALSEHTGSGLFNKKENGKYSMFLPVTNLGELGSAPAQIEKTVVGNMARSYVEGRKDSPQQTLTYYYHRDNRRIVESYKGKTVEFLRVFPDFSAVKYSGTISSRITDTAMGDNVEQAELTITVTVPEQVVDNCLDLIEDTAIFTNDIPAVLSIAKSKSEKINVETNPGDATVTAEAETDGVCTATYQDGILTIEATTVGSTVVTLKTSAEGYNGWSRTILVVVTE